MMWQALPQKVGVDDTCMANSMATMPSPSASDRAKVITFIPRGVSLPPERRATQRPSQESGPRPGSRIDGLGTGGAAVAEAPQHQHREEQVEPEQHQDELALLEPPKLAVDLRLHFGTHGARSSREAGDHLLVHR